MINEVSNFKFLNDLYNEFPNENYIINNISRSDRVFTKNDILLVLSLELFKVYEYLVKEEKVNHYHIENILKIYKVKHKYLKDCYYQ